jgi:hypothetical protein
MNSQTDAWPSERRCIDCGRPESEHCNFRAVPIPDGCKCHSDGTWQTSIPAVCTNYTKDHGDTTCVICEHDEACHHG